MKPGGPLRRLTPLRAKSPLRRYTGLRSSSLGRGATSGEGQPVGGSTTRPRATAHRVPAEVVAVVRARSRGRCEIAILGACLGEGTQRHHRVTRKMGGRHGAAASRSDRAANLLDACAGCHGLVTERPGLGYSFGWSLHEYEDPALTPVLYRGELAYLDDAGGVHAFEKASA